MKLITSVMKDSKKINQIAHLARAGTDSVVYGVSDSQKRHIANTVAEVTGFRGLYVAWNEMQARQAYLDLSYLTGDKAVYLSNREIMLYDVEARSFEQTHERIASLARILNGDYRFIVTSGEALMHYLMDPEDFSRQLVTLKPGDEVDISQLEMKLLEMGYETGTVFKTRRNSGHISGQLRNAVPY
jgi:transcription-repair coupling factor (superfamily II helicase)